MVLFHSTLLDEISFADAVPNGLAQTFAVSNAATTKTIHRAEYRVDAELDLWHMQSTSALLRVFALSIS